MDDYGMRGVAFACGNLPSEFGLTLLGVIPSFWNSGVRYWEVLVTIINRSWPDLLDFPGIRRQSLYSVLP
jgi:hypothetical protein